MFSENIGLLCSRSLPHQMLIISINVCLNDIFWTAEPFITKFGMVIHIHKLGWDVINNNNNKTGLLSSRSKSQLGLIESKYDCFYCIFWTSDPFLTKFCIVVHHHKLEHLVERLLCCVQSQGHREGSYLRWMFVLTISSWLFNLSYPNLAWCYTTMSQSVLSTDCCASIMSWS